MVKKIVLIACVATTGLLFAAESRASSSDQYYSALDLDGAIVAEYEAQTNNEDPGRQPYRKRAHRRKRIIRPPVQGK